MPRIGELLSRAVPLSDHDLEEILQEQKATRQRFGEAALSLGKVSSQQVWDAWIAQIIQGQTDPLRMPPDFAAAAILPPDLATTFGLVPLRLRGTVLVVAATRPPPESAVQQVERRCGVQLIVARTTPAAARQALAEIYPAAAPAA